MMIWLASVASATAGTVVRFTISGASFDVELYDETTPATVENFLEYVSAGLYEGSVIHRSEPGFIWQGGGYYLDGDPVQAVPIATLSPVVNEPVHSNIRGTIAMAKIDGYPNSATSQWFFNLADNSANLDSANGGFTVFGHVLGNGMATLDLLSAFPVDDFSPYLGPYGAAFTNTPYYQLEESEDRYPLVVQGIAVVPVPEPSTWALAAAGLAMVALRRRRKM